MSPRNKHQHSNKLEQPSALAITAPSSAIGSCSNMYLLRGSIFLLVAAAAAAAAVAVAVAVLLLLLLLQPPPLLRCRCRCCCCC